jgi:translation initiation factor 2B subunit (eIF-2B alpha/beta/delta family)
MINELEKINVDLTKRSEDDWAKIYHIKILDDTISNNLMTEFEWAYRMNDMKYILLQNEKKSFEDAEKMELRAMMIMCDVISHADKAERDILKNQHTFINTQYILSYSCSN